MFQVSEFLEAKHQIVSFGHITQSLSREMVTHLTRTLSLEKEKGYRRESDAPPRMTDMQVGRIAFRFTDAKNCSNVVSPSDVRPPTVPSVIAFDKTSRSLNYQNSHRPNTRQSYLRDADSIFDSIMISYPLCTTKFYKTPCLRLMTAQAGRRGEALEAIMESLPLAKEDMLDHEYIPVGPLMPLRLLMGSKPATQAS